MKIFIVRLVLTLFFWFIFCIPIWIRAISISNWRVFTKKIAIIAMVSAMTGFSLYVFFRSPTNTSSLSWLGSVSITIYFIATIVSAYYAWPLKSRSQSVITGKVASKRILHRKNRIYVIIPYMTGTDEDASVTFINATFQKTSRPVKRYPAPDFGIWLIEQIYNENKVMAEKTGVLKNRLLCSSCGTELNHNDQLLRKIEYELKYNDFDPFTMQIAIPSIVCPQCSKICGVDLNGSLSYHLNEAIIRAFKSEKIKP